VKIALAVNSNRAMMWFVRLADTNPAMAKSALELDAEHAVEVVGLTPALLYFAYIVWKGSLGLLDAGVLLLMYVTYLVILQRIPPKDHEEIEDTGIVPRVVLGLRSPWRAIAVSRSSSSAA